MIVELIFGRISPRVAVALGSASTLGSGALEVAPSPALAQALTPVLMGPAGPSTPGPAGATGAAGGRGYIYGSGPSGTGGAGGAAVVGNSNITWIATGTRYGAIT